MKETKKVENQPTQRLRYEAPRVRCIPIETESILATSGGTGPLFGGSTGDGSGANTINKQDVGMFNSTRPEFGSGVIGGGSGGGQASIGTVNTGDFL